MSSTEDRKPRNLSFGETETEFFVWVDPNSPVIAHSIKLVGSFVGGPVASGSDDPKNLMFLHNDNEHKEVISPFHSSVLRNYLVEYNLDRFRWHSYNEHPSRLFAIFLLRNREDALKYKEYHQDHVRDRVLKRAVSVGAFKCSFHDSAWIDFLRSGAGMDDETIHNIQTEYWEGRVAEGQNLRAFGKPWPAKSSCEVLFYGRIDFPNRNLNDD